MSKVGNLPNNLGTNIIPNKTLEKEHTNNIKKHFVLPRFIYYLYLLTGLAHVIAIFKKKYIEVD